MAGGPALIVGVALLLSYFSPLQTAAQSVVITGTDAMAGERHDLICTYSAPDPIPSLKYRWCAQGICRPVSTSNLYDLDFVVLSDAHDQYTCEVLQADTDTVLGSITGSLRVRIPDILMSFNRASGGRTNYVGLNVSIACRTRFVRNLEGITTDITISNSNGTEVGASERFIITDTTSGDDFERTLTFTPISEGDAGVYLCTGTAQSAILNPLVTAGTGGENLTISTVHVPIIEVDVSPSTGRYLDIPPYNSLTLTCTTSITVRGVDTPLNMVFQWRQSGNGSEDSPVSTEHVSHSNLFGAQGSSVLSLNLTQPGYYSYTCVSSLDVTPANDVITSTHTINITVAGPSVPAPPLNLTTPLPTLLHDRVTVHFLVPSLTYDPEVYWVRYGTSSSSSNLTEAEESTPPVSSGPSIRAVDISLSVLLEGLRTNTTYYYLVVANNSVGMTESTVSTFTTTGLPPEPPSALRGNPHPTTRNTYTFTWTPPTVTNGDLLEYMLICVPPDRESNEELVIMIPSPAERGEVGGFPYGVEYECVVRVRNSASYSQDSNSVEVIFMQSLPGAVICGKRWGIEPLPQGGSVNVNISWSAPLEDNGVILWYILQLSRYDGSEEIRNVNTSGTNTSYTFTNLTLVEGVPYNISILPENAAGRGQEVCTLTDFSDQAAPPPVRGLSLSRSSSGSEIDVSWAVLSLVEARGFLNYTISFSTPADQRGRRQNSEGCVQSPCVVAMESGGVTIMELDPGSDYLVSVMPVNEENEDGEVASSNVKAVASFPIVYVIVGVVVGVAALICIIVILLICIMFCKRRDSNRDYGVKPKPLTMELDVKSKDYVNDTDLSRDHPPLYAPVPVAERLRLIPIAQFKFHVKDMHADKDKKFELEYESLGNERLASCEIAKINKAKNRFANIFPYDFSRVKLESIEGMDGSDYINASYIDGHKLASAYIAAQGPMPNTIGDFWRMIWEHELNTVINLTKVNEGGKKKCEQYWPDVVGKTQQTDTLEITLKELMPFADYEIRKFEVQDVSADGEVPRLVTQYHFLGWPDHGVPKYATSLIEFIRRVRNCCVSTSKGILVHCSAGVGRTGTYITLDAMLERMKEEGTINVYEFVRNMRAKRICMVQTQAQYVFIHDALDELITCGETAIRAPDLRAAINTLNEVNPKTAMTKFEEQFKLLHEVSRVPSDSDCSDALQHYNQTKNRYQDNMKIPYSSNRVRLRPTAAQGSEYINASFVDGYKHRNAYIATQAPLETTVTEFWRMIWEFKSRVVVMLCQTQEEGQEVSHGYWPTGVNDEMCVGKLSVTLISEKQRKDYIERKLRIKEDEAEDTPGQGFIVTQYHYLPWVEHDRAPSSSTLLQMIKSLNNTQRNTGNKPITIMCNDGIGRTGSFICIHAMLERVNTENVVDFFQFIKSSRIHRPSLVMELEHYRFCHDTLADYLESLDTYANFKDLS